MTSATRVTMLALATQGLLAAAGLVAATWARVPVRLGARPGLGLLAGLGVAGVLAVANHQAFSRAGAGLGALRAVVDEVLVPTFGTLGHVQIVCVSLAAGLGEELFFRGWLQAVAGWLPASLAFGLAHVAGARLVVLGVWATGMGLVLGGLMIWTGGLLAPVTAHACYDVLAFHYLRRLARQRTGEEG